MKHWSDKILDLIEKEIKLYDTRPKKERKYHPTGECYMGEIIELVDKLLKEKTVCCMDGCGNVNCKHCRWKRNEKEKIKYLGLPMATVPLVRKSYS